MSVVTPYIRLQDLGLPIVRPDNVGISSGGSKISSHISDVPRLLGQTLITTFTFLIIIIWFTLALNASTREQIDSEYFLFQFAVYFSIIAIFIIIFIILLIT